MTENCFDVTMDSLNGSEISERIGTYIQSNLENILPKPILEYTEMLINSFKKP